MTTRDNATADSTLGYLFPGQGSQSVGMLDALAAEQPAVRETFAEASDVLGYDLLALCQRGPAERLDATEQTQPAMLAAGVATWRVFEAAGGLPARALAGHSLGEYAALVAAGALDFAAAVHAVRERSAGMQAAVPSGEGGIAALLGLDDAQAQGVCDAVNANGDPGVWPVNYNAPGQVVIAGRRAAVDAAIEAAKEAGARRAIALPMSVPVHCPLMKPAAERLAAALASTPVRNPRIPVVQNADVGAHETPDAIRAALVEQLTAPVRWTATVEALAARGCTHFVELGPGKVLTGLAKRIRRDLPCRAVHDPASLAAALAD